MDFEDSIKNKNYVEIGENFQKACKLVKAKYERGLVSRQNALKAFVEVRDEVSLIISMETGFNYDFLPYKMLNEFIEDYKRYPNEEIKGDWWNENVTNKGIYSATDIIEFYKALCFPVEYFYRVDPKYPNPGVRYRGCGNYGNIYEIPFICINDGGLRSDHNPVGKEFKLISTDHIAANIKVNSFEKGNKDTGDLFTRSYDVYKCTGTIEQYYFCNTNPPKPNITLEFSDRLIHLKVETFDNIFEKDYSVDFPQWKEYNEASEEIAKLRAQADEKFMDYVLSQS